MSLDRLFIEITGMLILFGIPVFVLTYPRLPRWPRSLAARMVVTILVVWFHLIVHRMASLPTLIRDAEAAGNMVYDGVFGNVAIIVFGWLVALVGCVPALIISTVKEKMANQRQRALAEESKPCQTSKNTY